MIAPVPFEPGIHGDRAALFAALVKAKSAFSHAEHDSNNPHFKKSYASLASVVDATDPGLHANGLAFMQPLDEGTGGLLLYSILLHESGAYWCTRVALDPVKSMQDFGSQCTYMKRYTRMAMLGVAAIEDDDDGNAGNSFRPGQRTQAQPPSPRQAPASQPKPTNGGATSYPWDPEPGLADHATSRIDGEPRPILELMRDTLAVALEVGVIKALPEGRDPGPPYVRQVLKRDDLSTGLSVGEVRRVIASLAEKGVKPPHAQR